MNYCFELLERRPAYIMKKAVLVDQKFFQHDMQYERETFAAHGIDFIVTQVENDSEYIAACEDADAVLIAYADTSRNVISQLKNCKVLVRYGVGYDVIDVDAATEYGIAACNIPHYCSEEVAVHTCALILDCVRRITIDNQHTKSGDWFIAPSYEYNRLSKMTVGILGFGNIARKVASYMKGFGCRLVAYDPYLPDDVFLQMGVERLRKEDVCQIADIITIHIPYNKETHHTLDKADFDRMKKGVMIINTSRGGLINQAALCDALDAGIVRAAGLDVLEGEPITDPTSRIFQYENVTITPHRAAQSVEAIKDLIAQVVQTAIVAIEGEIPPNAVNRKALIARGIDKL